jgi:hypothetical protein
MDGLVMFVVRLQMFAFAFLLLHVAAIVVFHLVWIHDTMQQTSPFAHITFIIATVSVDVHVFMG